MMSFNKALIKGDMKQVSRLMRRGKKWVGPKNSYKEARLSDRSFKFPTKPETLADCLLTVLDLKLVDSNDGIDGVDWVWFFMFDDSKNPVITSDDGELSACYDAYITADKRLMPDQDDISRPQVKLFFDDRYSMYRFVVEQYDDSSDPIVYNNCFNREDAILFLSKLLPYTYGPYSC